MSFVGKNTDRMPVELLELALMRTFIKLFTEHLQSHYTLIKNLLNQPRTKLRQIKNLVKKSPTKFWVTSSKFFSWRNIIWDN